MSVLDELDLGRPPRPPWRPRATGSPRGRVLTGGLLTAVIAVAVLLAQRSASPPADGGPPTSTTSPTAAPLVVRLPTFDAGTPVVVPVDPTACPLGSACETTATLSAGLESALRGAFPSAGDIGRLRVTDAGTGRTYLQEIRFTTGGQVNIVVTQRPADLVPGAAPPDDLTPTPRDVDGGYLTLWQTRAGYLTLAQVAGLPGQSLPVNAVRRFLLTAPAP